MNVMHDTCLIACKLNWCINLERKMFKTKLHDNVTTIYVLNVRKQYLRFSCIWLYAEIKATSIKISHINKKYKKVYPWYDLYHTTGIINIECGWVGIMRRWCETCAYIFVRMLPFFGLTIRYICWIWKPYECN